MNNRHKKLGTNLERFARRIRLVVASFSIFSVALLVLLMNTSSTISYFSDNEPSRANEFAAGLLDFAVSPSDTVEFFIGPENGGDETLVPVFAPMSGSFDTRYRVFAQKQSGQTTFCNNIQASATTSPFTYSGPLLSLSTGDTNIQGPWMLALSLSSLSGVSHTDVCYVDLIYRGWRDGASEGEGYVDEERVRLSLRPRTIVLNEFLPHPNGIAYGFDFGTDSSNMPQGEWVELFNNSGSSRNLSGWYIWDASGFESNKVYITASSTDTGSTVIPGGGWLVVYMNKAVLNNGGDDVRLYNPSNVLVDSFAYANHDVCSYEPTPGDPNALSGSGTGCDPVPPNKSYARIPDGLGAWLDPIPTPGFSNTLDPNQAQADMIQLEINLNSGLNSATTTPTVEIATTTLESAPASLIDDTEATTTPSEATTTPEQVFDGQASSTEATTTPDLLNPQSDISTTTPTTLEPDATTALTEPVTDTSTSAPETAPDLSSSTADVSTITQTEPQPDTTTTSTDPTVAPADVTPPSLPAEPAPADVPPPATPVQ